MSRVEQISLGDDFASLARAQTEDDELENIRNNSSLKLVPTLIPGSNITILCDDTTGKPRPYLPPQHRRAAFDRLHNLSHPGVRATTRLVADRYVWPGIKKDCRNWSRECLACQKCKVTRHVSAPLADFPTPSGRFKHVHLDIIGPLPSSNGYTYCLTAIDRFTRWPEAWPMTNITAEEVADQFLHGWIARFGVPTTVTTDQGRQFESTLFNKLLDLGATRRARTTSYHPQANGMVERFHRHLKAAIMCHSQSWHKALPLVLLGIRSALKEDLRCSSADLAYGEPLRLPGELLVPSGTPLHTSDDFMARLQSTMAKVRPAPASRHTEPKTFVFKNLSDASHIFLRDVTVRRALQPPYTGPYKVINRTDKTLTIQMPGRSVQVSIDRTKPAFIAPQMEPTSIKTVPTSVPASTADRSVQPNAALPPAST